MLARVISAEISRLEQGMPMPIVSSAWMRR
jgi:hypothetical protein